MRFTEIINPEDQLALWRLISDKVWATFGQLPQQLTAPDHQSSIAAGLAKPTPKAATKGGARISAKGVGKRKVISAKGYKPKRAPMAAPPKPLPKAQNVPLTPTQAQQSQADQHHQLAQHIKKAMSLNTPNQSNQVVVTPKTFDSSEQSPINSSYNDRDTDELLFHRRANPLKPLRLQ